MYQEKINEESLKNKVAADFFSPNPQSKHLTLTKEQKAILKTLDSTSILGRIDFSISYHSKTLLQPINFLWAEAKKGNKNDIIESFIQLILTIGREKSCENNLPPIFLGAFDCEKIAFIPYHELDFIFTQNDFNWNVVPSNHDTKEFKQLYALAKELLESKKLQFNFKENYKELQDFITLNFTLNNENIAKIPITKNNFTSVYQKWLAVVAPSISINWDDEKPDILSSDFYLADLLSENNNTKAILDSLRILLQSDLYKVKLERRSNSTSFNFTEFGFNDNQKAHIQFWNLYERPPKEEYWSYIIERRDLLVPSDIRERKGAFFTPQIWVQKAQYYLEKSLGQNYQSEYVIWDCSAGTGNLLANLTESHRLYASTLDKADVDIMQELQSKGTLHLLPKHIFQFDFLNDSFFDKPCSKHAIKQTNKEKDNKELVNAENNKKAQTQNLTETSINISNDFRGFANQECKDCKQSKLPKGLQEILKDEAKRKKLIIFINPPYAEAGTASQATGTGKNKSGVALNNAIYERYKDIMGKASNELFTQFFFRIYKEIQGCILASFATLKYVNSTNFIKFRETFRAEFLNGFICPSYTFDNVKGSFPISFIVWNLGKNDKLQDITLDVFDDKGESLGEKRVYNVLDTQNSLSKWIAQYGNKTPPPI